MMWVIMVDRSLAHGHSRLWPQLNISWARLPSQLPPRSRGGTAHLTLPLVIEQRFRVPFQKAYNMDTLEPTPEWDSAYRNVKAECIELGIPLDG